MERVSQLFVTYLINSAWQVPIICGLAFVGSLILRRTPAKWSHLLWVLALIASLLLPLWSLRAITPETKPTIVAPDSETDIAQAETLRVTAAARPQARRSWFHPASVSIHARPRLVWMIAACYCIFVLYRLSRLVLAVAHTWNLRALAVHSSASDNLRSIIERYSARLRLRGSPAVFLTDGVGPLTVGVRRPILLMPSAFCKTAPEAELNAAVCHELAHIKRHDFLLNLICEFILLPVCYHPLAALIKTRIDRSRELACDDMAAELMTAPAVYARSLVSIAKSISTSSVPRLSCGQGLFDTEVMEERIMNLLGNRPIIHKNWARAIAAGTITVFAGISLGAAAFSFQVAPRTMAPAIVSANTAGEKITQQQDTSGTQWNVGVQAEPGGAALPQKDDQNPNARVVIRNFTLKGGDAISGAQDALSNDLKSRNYGTDISRTIPVWVRVFYLERGYLQAVCSEPVITQAGPSSVDVSVSVDPGPQFQLRDIQFTGNTKITNAELRSLFPIQQGETFNGEAISKGLDAMRRLYLERGYGKVSYSQSVQAEPSSRTAVVNIVVGDGGNGSEQNLSGYYKVGDGVTAPVPIYQPGPHYDAAARDAKAEGVGVFQVGVGADGTVQTVQPVSGVYPDLHPSLVQSSIDAIRNWKFKPALKDGQPVPAQFKVEMNFRLK